MSINVHTCKLSEKVNFQLSSTDNCHKAKKSCCNHSNTNKSENSDCCSIEAQFFHIDVDLAYSKVKELKQASLFNIAFILDKQFYLIQNNILHATPFAIRPIRSVPIHIWHVAFLC